MMNSNQIGVTFMPSAENQADGPRQGGLQGDVGQALKILSLQLPRVMGARSITDPSLMRGGGANSGLASPGFNPHAAVFEALLHALSQGGAGMFGGGGSQGVPAPNVIPGVGQGEPPPGSFNPGGQTPIENTTGPIRSGMTWGTPAYRRPAGGGGY